MPLPVKLTVANWLAFTLLSLFPRGAGERWNFDINLLLQRNYSYWRGEKLLLSRANDENVKICHRKSYTKSKTWQLSHLGESLSQSFNFPSGCFFSLFSDIALIPTHRSRIESRNLRVSFLLSIPTDWLFFSTLNFFFAHESLSSRSHSAAAASAQLSSIKLCDFFFFFSSLSRALWCMSELCFCVYVDGYMKPPTNCSALALWFMVLLVEWRRGREFSTVKWAIFSASFTHWQQEERGGIKRLAKIVKLTQIIPTCFPYFHQSTFFSVLKLSNNIVHVV